MKTSRSGSSTALTARHNISSWRIFRSARTILIWQRLLPRVPCTSARHYSRRTRKSRFLSRKSRLPGSRYEKEWSCGYATPQCGKAPPFRKMLMKEMERLRLDQGEQKHSLPGFKLVGSAGKAEPYRTVLRHSRTASVTTLMLCISLCCSACRQGIRRSGIPAEAQSALDTSIEDIDAG